MVHCSECGIWLCTHEIDYYCTIGGVFFCEDCYPVRDEEEDDMQKPVELYNAVSVDEIYNAMDEGQRCHMANKLWKHGYRSPKANTGKVINVDGVDYRLVREGE